MIRQASQPLSKIVQGRHKISDSNPMSWCAVRPYNAAYSNAICGVPAFVSIRVSSDSFGRCEKDGLRTS